jgi:hypothetical protein
MTKTVEVKFYDSYGSKTYHYLTDDNRVTEGSYVIVDSPSTKYTIVKVNAVLTTDVTTQATKWIVDVVDDIEYKKRKADAKEKQAILTLLESKSKKVLEEHKYAFLSAYDPEASKLLERLKELNRNV